MNNNYNENENSELENKINEDIIKEKEDIEEQYRILKDEEEKEKKRKAVLLIVLFLLLFGVCFTGSIISYFSYKHSQDGEPSKVEEGNNNKIEYGLNCDTNGDGIPDLNIDYDSDGVCDFNCDTNNNGRPDTNLMNLDTDNDGICNLNCDTDNDGYPDVNIDIDGDGQPDLNIDIDGDGKPDINIDTDRDKVCNLNCDTDGDKKPDVNIDTDGDGKADTNISNDNNSGTTTNPNTGNKPSTSNKPSTGNKPSGGNTTPSKPSGGNTTTTQPEINIEMFVLFSASNKFEANNIIPGWRSKEPHEFLVRNTGAHAAIYDVVFNKINSNFENPENLRYTITCNDMVIVSDAPVPTSDKIVLSGETVAVGETNVYKVYYRFVETGLNQDKDQGKTYNVSVDVRGRS